VFHLILGAHHIRMVSNYQIYDWTYTGLGIVLIGIGWLLEYRAKQQHPPALQRREERVTGRRAGGASGHRMHSLARRCGLPNGHRRASSGRVW